MDSNQITIAVNGKQMTLGEFCKRSGFVLTPFQIQYLDQLQAEHEKAKRTIIKIVGGGIVSSLSGRLDDMEKMRILEKAADHKVVDFLNPAVTRRRGKSIAQCLAVTYQAQSVVKQSYTKQHNNHPIPRFNRGNK